MIFSKIPPPFNGQEMWGAATAKGTFIILRDAFGYTASFKVHPSASRVDIIPYDAAVSTFDMAKAACEKYHNSLQ